MHSKHPIKQKQYENYSDKGVHLITPKIVNRALICSFKQLSIHPIFITVHSLFHFLRFRFRTSLLLINISTKTKIKKMKQTLILAIAIIAFGSCKKNQDNEANGIFKGPELQVHGGKTWSWIQLNKNGNPERIGISLTDKALNSVPIGNGESGHAHGGGNNWELKFHPKASILPFKFIGLNWNPNGHEPEPIYGKPHFDFHFFMIPEEKVAAIPSYEQDSLKFKNIPAASYLPAAYVYPGSGVAMMGAHWIDFSSPELNGHPFTETFIFGSYEGDVTFYEPMITLEFLKANSNYSRPIPQPVKYQKTGWYPTLMRVVKHDEITEVVLDAFVYRTQS
jgi:hypothetical protein